LPLSHAERVPCISIHAPRAGSDPVVPAAVVRKFAISIHAPRAGSDKYIAITERGTSISIHAPRAGSDGQLSPIQNTYRDFNPRSPRGERQNGPDSGINIPGISIHAPRAGSDGALAVDVEILRDISIHAPRAGSDQRAGLRQSDYRHFNPRSPRGERPSAARKKAAASIFQSTLPARGATQQYDVALVQCDISIHAPRAGSDCTASPMFHLHSISIHAPRAGSDSKIVQTNGEMMLIFARYRHKKTNTKTKMRIMR